MLNDLLFLALYSAPGQPAYAFLSDTGNMLAPPTFQAPNGVNQYMIGNVVRLAVQFQDINKNPVDPGTVTLWVRNPDYSEDEFQFGTAEIIRDGVGNYHFNLPNSQSGYYNYRWEGEGNVVVANDSQINSIPSVFVQ